MSTKTYPIVGAYFRPPAQALLNALRVGAALHLRAEPTNAYDPNAIAVFLDELPPETPDLSEALAGFGVAYDDLTLPIHVGYIPKELAAELCAQGFPQDIDIPAQFSVGSNGGPRVRFEV